MLNKFFRQIDLSEKLGKNLPDWGAVGRRTTKLYISHKYSALSPPKALVWKPLGVAEAIIAS